MTSVKLFHVTDVYAPNKCHKMLSYHFPVFQKLIVSTVTGGNSAVSTYNSADSLNDHLRFQKC